MKNDGFVLDTNVLISAALSANSPPAQVTLWVINHARLIFSDPTFEELRSRIWRPKFDRYLSIERRNILLHDLRAIAEWVEFDEGHLPVASRDPDDDMFIQTAIAGSAHWLVTGDRDLLEVEGLATPRIVTPAEMMTHIAPVQ
jgi:putative PIN family toxin of toxin-antitoxin system